MATKISFDSLLQIIARKHGLKAMSDQCNLCLSIARGCGLEAMMDHVSIALDYFTIDEQVAWTEAIMDRVYDGIQSIKFDLTSDETL